jgi:hypothetical protein
MSTNPHVNYVAAYENGWRDGQKAMKETLKAKKHEERDLKVAIVSIECTIAWLDNGNDPKQAAQELRHALARLKDAT